MTAQTRDSYTMGLLQSLWQDDPSPEYAEAAAHPHPTSKPKHAVIIAVAVILGIVLAAATVQLRTPKPQAQKTRDYLVGRIHDKTKEADKLAAGNARMSAAIETAQQKALHGQNNALLARNRRLQVVAGATAVSGEGVRITLSDGQTSDDSDSDSDPRKNSDTDSRVQDRDVQTIVNSLWAVGASAITINGQRLTSLSSIRSAGGAILVDYKPLTQPYTIDALGNSDSLQSRFAASTGGSYLQGLKSNYGIDYQVAGESDTTLPASDSLRLHVAHAPAHSNDSPPTGGNP